MSDDRDRFERSVSLLDLLLLVPDTGSRFVPINLFGSHVYVEENQKDLAVGLV